MSFADDYFAMLEDWKQLPKYQMERRIDSLVGFVLPALLRRELGVEATVVIPELPLRKDSIEPPAPGQTQSNHSVNVDFYVLGRGGENLFIEFKSDSRSRRTEQDDYLLAAQRAGMRVVLDGIRQIRAATAQKKKYEVLLEKLRGCGLLEGLTPTPKQDQIRVIYLQPRALDGHDGEENLTFNQLADTIETEFAEEAFLVRFAQSVRSWVQD
jgi:hypothetical protein